MLILSLCRALWRLASPLEGVGIVLPFINGDRRSAVGSLPRASVLRRGWLAAAAHVKLLVVACTVVRRTTRSGRLRASRRGGVQRIALPYGGLCCAVAHQCCWLSASVCALQPEGRLALSLFTPGERWTLTPRTFAVRCMSVTLQHVLAGVCACVPSL